ncbi:lytic transglycosylase domain-containing protein [Gordonia sp. NPDC003425]
MGKHSKPRDPILGRVSGMSRAPLAAAALLAAGGALTAASSAGADHVQPSVPAVAAQSPHQESTGPDSPPARTLAVAPVVARPAAPPPPLPVSVTDGSVPTINYEAYRRAADTMARTQPGCGIPWTLIAGIGKVESHHANEGDTDAHGALRTPIFGPALDGSLAGNQVVADTDGGRLDGDPTHDRAVGPMQFLPATWQKYAADGNGDGIADPQNIFDAALTTARYLCDGNLDLRNPVAEGTAVLRYNNSADYVSNVLGFARSY